MAISLTADSSTENSAYASSTINRPLTAFVAEANVSRSENEVAVPLGLLGVVINVNPGFNSAI
ncbi:unannotated protein [freshwater metagenome]|uniref:Unannotated protein n=1 Tax=freshwater metagenome TaxID=449393 RepID=A0A6J7AY98_9ZZZZ